LKLKYGDLMNAPATEGITKRAISLPGPCARDESLDITVLMGGPSREREVSLTSGSAVAGALEQLGHRVTRSDIGPDDVSALDRPGIDLVFIALHGWFGESGEVQDLCEARGLCYVGSSPKASRIAMNKSHTKDAFRLAGLATPDWVIADTASAWREKVQALPLPVVVKPVDGGSSVDVTIAKDAGRRDAAVESMLAEYGSAMIERFVQGRELTVGILGNKALPIIEVIPGRDFYDYTAKYADGAGTRYSFDHGLGSRVRQEVLDLSIAAHECIGCRDMSRVDFILDEHERPWLLEINTIPGFTSHSLLPMAAKQEGLDFAAMVSRIVKLAMQRQGVRQAIQR
jgi:D-alanine-D-alanine ligase